MLLSMTGIGEARSQADDMTVQVEVRSVNNRHLKTTIRTGDTYASLEPEIDRVIRAHVKRGTIHLVLRIERPRSPEDYRLNLVALGSYREQVEKLAGPHATPPDLAALLVLPGVVEERWVDDVSPHDDWPRIEYVLTEALVALNKARKEEGRAMSEELLKLSEIITEHLDRIAARGPEVISSYQDRLTERVQALVARHGIAVGSSDLIREVAILAERADIVEEVLRLRAHLAQFDELLRGPESAGRKLEFVVQEMGRETNTIGSKANDVIISREVVEIKGRLESIRELIQNVE